jgi:energy-coupling factor transporter ATP-binding protein EcfA2
MECNLLILDEPTNFLDIETKEIIEEALRDYEGALLIISHDRYFIRAVAEEIWHLAERKLTVYEGDYEYYLSKQIPEKENQEDILIMEMNLAELAHKMTLAGKEEKKKMEEEYFRIASRMHQIKNR